jgi:hypothetical protein
MPNKEIVPRDNDNLLTEEQKEIREAVDALYKRLKY